MTKQQALAAIKKGWETVGYTSGRWYDTSPAGVAWHRKKPKCACAIGAGAYALKMHIYKFEGLLCDANIDYVELIQISDQAGSKEAAIAALEAWAS
jgi:hypothetical protein